VIGGNEVRGALFWSVSHTRKWKGEEREGVNETENDEEEF
jgi:hypothetical protein